MLFTVENSYVSKYQMSRKKNCLFTRSVFPLKCKLVSFFAVVVGDGWCYLVLGNLGVSEGLRFGVLFVCF